MAKYIYQRTGGPLVVWGTRPPYQARAADAKSLGSLGGDSLDAPRLPRAGAPEYISDPGRPRPMGCSDRPRRESIEIDLTGPALLLAGYLMGKWLNKPSS